MSGARHVWVAPPFTGIPTGGTVYNAELLRALERQGFPCERVDVEAAKHVAKDPTANLWVDSLHLDAMAALRRLSPKVNLVAHYLPSLVREPDLRIRERLTEVERAALDSASRLLTTSVWFAERLVELGAPRGRVLTVEPGVDVDIPGGEPEGDVSVTVSSAGHAGQASLAALVVANLLPGKGILGLLRALGRVIAGTSVELTVIGSPDMDRSHAAACMELVERDTELSKRVRFLGAVPYRSLGTFFARHDVLVSASRMETFGMAVFAARAAGVPILARRGGNVAAHVEEDAGGSLFDDDQALANAVVRLARNPRELGRRKHLARARRPRRSWDQAAREFVCGLSVRS